jgi:predicted metal-binding protein
MRSLAGRGASVSVVHSLHPVTHVGAARVSSCDQASVTDRAASADAPTIYVCVTCRPVGEPDSELRPGAVLAAAVERAAAGTEVTVRPMRCLANCSRGPSAALRCNGSWTYVFGGLDPAFAGALVEGARMLARAADGILPWRGRPEPLKRGLIARVPPIGFEEVDA